jgi:hypothetical protein
MMLVQYQEKYYKYPIENKSKSVVCLMVASIVPNTRLTIVLLVSCLGVNLFADSRCQTS